MKKLRFALVCLLLIGTLLGCSAFFPVDPTVRFENLISNFQFNYGLKFGSAEYTGVLAYGHNTAYFSTPAGTYSLEAMNSSGQWLTVSTGTTTVANGHNYTVVITGTYDAGTGNITNSAIQIIKDN